MKRRTSLEIQVDADLRAADAELHRLQLRLDALGERIGALRAQVAAAQFIDCNARPPRRQPPAPSRAVPRGVRSWRPGWDLHPSQP